MKSPKQPTRIEPDSLLTSYQVGGLLQVNPSSINKWVKDGRIPAFRTPGGHRRIRASDLVAFLQSHQMPVPRGLANAARRRLLIVDGDAKQLESMQRVLKGHNSRIDTLLSDNGIDALVQVGAFKPQVVVLDAELPNLNGVEVAARLKDNPDTAGIRCIVTSASMNADVEKKAKKAGAHACVPKPLELDVLFEALELSDDAFAY